MKKTALAVGIILALGAGSAFAAERTGKEVYDTFCKACHNTGIAGAPKYGDKAWTTLEKADGMKGLLAEATKGKKAMPPKGNCKDCTENEMKGAIQHLIDSAKGAK